jgi:hypothetical protein
MIRLDLRHSVLFEPSPLQCLVCEKQETYVHKIQRCAKCLSVYYCSKECQTKDWWEKHRVECKKSRKTLAIRKKALDAELRVCFPYENIRKDFYAGKITRLEASFRASQTVAAWRDMQAIEDIEENNLISLTAAKEYDENAQLCGLPIRTLSLFVITAFQENYKKDRMLTVNFNSENTGSTLMLLSAYTNE